MIASSLRLLHPASWGILFDLVCTPNAPSARIALLRAHWCVARDREAVPCGRWVLVRRANPGFQWGRPYLPPAMNRKLKKTVLRWRVRR